LRFFQERFLTRIGRSVYQDHLVLKGGLLLLNRHITPFRPTIDIDMLGIDISNDPQHLQAVICKIAGIDLNDVIQFNTDTITHTIIKEDADYEGNRFTFGVRLGKINSRMQLDIGFGDAVPSPYKKSILPALLEDFSAPELLIYPLESVISEKFQAIVYLGTATSRMKDFYDIIFLAENNSFILQNLKSALEATFNCRETDLEKRLSIYQSEYISDKAKLWIPFLRKIGVDDGELFSDVIQQIKDFLEPVVKSGKNDDGLVWDPNTWRWKGSAESITQSASKI
jgi:hypothetical protein